uniref:AMP-dependent synthetase/ligase domain-containing protein n=1 Tax=Araucaria cunninghamii TaxID=56994 RepID=A0A0D6QX08_ARACU
MESNKVYPHVENVTASEIAEAGGISSADAAVFHEKLQKILKECGGCRIRTWNLISTSLLRPDHAFALHQMMYYGCYGDWDASKNGPPPAWTPSLESAILTNVGRLLQRCGSDLLGSAYTNPIASFSRFYRLSVDNPEIYWNIIFRELNISFNVRPSRILDAMTSMEDNECSPGGVWLPGAMLNIAENCLVPNSKKKPNDVAIIWQDEGKDDLPLNVLTFEEVRAKVCHVANAIETLCLPKGSAVAIDMPMVATSVIIYLALVLAGYVVVSIAESFASQQIATRLKISNAKAIFTQDVIVRGDRALPLYTRVIEANSPIAIVVPGRDTSLCMPLRQGDISWEEFLGRTQFMDRVYEYTAAVQPVQAMSNILFSSGTTGEPKAIPWTHATPLKAAADAWVHMDIRSGDVVAFPTSLGWMMGPWLVYASLLNGASMALYNGSPIGRGFTKFVQDAKVTMLGIVPSLGRAWKRMNCVAGLDWSNIRCFGSTGEASSVDEHLWLMGRASYRPVIEYCGGTEIGGAFVTGSMLQPQSLSTFSTPAMGCSIFILGEDDLPLAEDEPGIGELALHPSIFGASTKLLNASHYNVYFKGMPQYNGKILRRHGDAFERTVGGYYRAHGRVDDTMNLGGIKVSSVEIERVCNGVDGRVMETAAIGIPPEGGGPEQLLIVIVLKDAENKETNFDDIKAAFNLALQKKLNPLFRVSFIAAVPSLPRTASNKIMRRVLRTQFSNLNRSSTRSAKL